MTAPTFFCRDGNLFYGDWCFYDDRDRMEKLALLFEAAKYREERALGAECRQALADFDAYHAKELDHVLG